MADPAPLRTGRPRRAALTVAAVALLAVALLLPDRPEQLAPSALLRVPLELPAFLLVAPVLPGRARTAAGLLFGALLGMLTVSRALDLGFRIEVGRPFDPVTDGPLLGSAVGVLASSAGDALAALAVGAGLLAAVAVPAVLAVAAARAAGAASRHRRTVLLTAPSVALAAVLAAGLGIRPAAVPLAAHQAIDAASSTAARVAASLRSGDRFEAELAAPDAYAAVGGDGLLSRLRGKDVLLAFVESYGRVAVEGTRFSHGVDAVLDRGTASLHAAGYGSRSAFLTSPTFGGISWLAHATLQSGLWVDSPASYDTLLARRRLTLAAAFHQAGWRTVDDVPSNTRPWPEGKRFYRYDRIYDAHDVGYAGPRFGYARIPDQYTLDAFRRLELAPGHRPVMAEIDLVSSHTPWTPLPRMVDPRRLGDGSVYAGMPALGVPADVAWRDPRRVQALYGRSIEYSLQSLLAFVETAHDRDLVVLLVGDHQPSATVSGAGASHDVPVSILTADPAVLARTDSWGWTPGLRPASTAPVWRMSAFRNRFLDAFGGAG